MEVLTLREFLGKFLLRMKTIVTKLKPNRWLRNPKEIKFKTMALIRLRIFSKRELKK